MTIQLCEAVDRVHYWLTLPVTKRKNKQTLTAKQLQLKQDM